MTRKVYAATMRSVFRSPVTWVCFVLILLNLVVRNESEGGFGTIVESVIQFARTTSVGSFHQAVDCFVFLSPIFVFQLLSDRDQDFYDITLATGVRQSSYLFGKMSALLTFYFGVTLFTVYAGYYRLYFNYVNGSNGMDVHQTHFEEIVRLAAAFFYLIVPFFLFLIMLLFAVIILSKRKLVGFIGSVGCFIFAHAMYMIIATATVHDRYPQNPYSLKRLIYLLGDGAQHGPFATAPLKNLLHLGSTALIEIFTYLGTAAVILLLLMFLLPQIRKNLFE